MQTGGMPVLTAEGTNRDPAAPRDATGARARPPAGDAPQPPGAGDPAHADPDEAGPARRLLRPCRRGRRRPHDQPRPGTPPQRPGRRRERPIDAADRLPPHRRRRSADDARHRRVAAAQKTTPVFDERVELQQVLDALGQKNWGAAKALLNGLAARVPASKQYRALLAYTRGREAQTAGRGEDAVMEFQRALQLDPDLQQAKSAMAELLRRR